MAGKRRVALIIETSSSYGRELLSGIVRFMRTHDEWSVFLEQRDLTTKPPDWLAHWRGHGIISRATTRRLARAVAATGVPLVELTDRHPADRHHDLGFPHVWSNDQRIGVLAAEHLLERGFRRFGFCGFQSEAWSVRRQQAFAAAVQAAGADCDVYSSSWHGIAARPWEEEQRQLVRWLRGLPRPIGIMACNDIRGQHLLEACSQAGLTVPEEVAVIGVDNDHLLCQLCDPPLSSVIPNAELIGFRAAELLAELMQGRRPQHQEQLIEPLGIATRQSTDVVAIPHPEMAAALSFIRENACRGITVGDVLRHVPVSRSSLERHLRKILKRSPQQEIRRVQLKRAQELLAATDLPLDRVARLCGFEHPEYLHVVFKRELQVTPGQYRRAARP